MVIAGEVSGDMHAAPLIESLRVANPDLQVWGIGGDRLREQDVELLYDVREMAVLGLWEVLKRYGFFRRVFDHMLRELDRRKPDAVLLIDYPGFNLRFARAAHQRGVKVLYYVCPQVWAWHRSRIAKMARIVDRLMVIFPFEVEVFKDTPLRVDFVGHPLVSAAQAALAEPETNIGWPGSGARVALLPGSRVQEVDRILPVMLDTACRLQEQDPDMTFAIAAPSAKIAEVIESRMAAAACLPNHLILVTGQTRQVLRQARAAMVASGTATIETALLGCPMIVVYRTSPLTYWVGRQVIQVPHLGMVNIVAGRELCPEFIQHAALPEAMAAALMPFIGDSPERKQMLEGLAEVARALGTEHPTRRAVEIITEELSSPRHE